VTITAELETRIGRPVAGVFTELSAVERFPEWLIASGIVRVQRLDDGPLASGSRLRIDQQVSGLANVLEGSITAFEPPSSTEPASAGRIALEGRSDSGVRVGFDASLLADGPVTRLRWSVRIDLPLRYRMLEGMLAPQVRRAATLDLEAFRIRLESVADG
jgi:hypothetical protein